MPRLPNPDRLSDQQKKEGVFDAEKERALWDAEIEVLENVRILIGNFFQQGVEGRSVEAILDALWLVESVIAQKKRQAFREWVNDQYPDKVIFMEDHARPLSKTEEAGESAKVIRFPKRKRHLAVRIEEKEATNDNSHLNLVR